MGHGVVSLWLACVLLFYGQVAHAADMGKGALMHEQQPEEGQEGCSWPRGGQRCCGTLRSPGAQHGGREDETDHCFPGSASDHMVCCVDIQNVDNEVNEHDPHVAYRNPLSGPIKRNSHASSYSWCTCSETVCTKQLKGRVAWVGKPGAA